MVMITWSDVFMKRRKCFNAVLKTFRGVTNNVFHYVLIDHCCKVVVNIALKIACYQNFYKEKHCEHLSHILIELTTKSKVLS